MKVCIIAGESSGDLLGAGLMQALHKKYPQMTFFGVGGDKMLEQGFNSLFPLDRLSVMGFWEPLKRLPELLSMRKKILETCLKEQIDLFIGIDSPEFNLGIEKRLKKRGIKTCHYVSPSVWAWRPGRIKNIKSAVDLMMVLLPFEQPFYEQADIPVAFVGHPLADTIPLVNATEAIRKKLNLKEAEHYLTMMPGSREQEVDLMGELFIDIAIQLIQKHPSLYVLIPAASEDREYQLIEKLNQVESKFRCRIKLFVGQSHDCIAAADAVCVASGTSTLETMLFKKPMVVAYKLSSVSYFIIKRLIRCPFIALPNLIANQQVVDEYIQDKANIEHLLPAVEGILFDETIRNKQISLFTDYHESMQQNADEKAAHAVAELLDNA